MCSRTAGTVGPERLAALALVFEKYPVYKGKPFTPREGAKHVLDVMASATPEDNGGFIQVVSRVTV